MRSRNGSNVTRCLFYFFDTLLDSQRSLAILSFVTVIGFCRLLLGIFYAPCVIISLISEGTALALAWIQPDSTVCYSRYIFS
ncbi:hypothetical protein V1525DRAFT_399820 [Lipomyces kononenkoae]|uniref:Uncharacterized protein n=1 Tax=Lipomyces kononenkoae TaxID=34357 RepID=A0ACC3T5H6_LIPKO